MKRLARAATVGTAGLMGLAVLTCALAGDLERVKRTIRSDFPGVPQMTVEALRTRFDEGSQPLLLDVREPEEHAVSTLPGARRLDPSAADAELASLPRDRDLVLFCSVGYRSSKLVDRLQKLGYSRVSNLEGSIFEWAEKGLPLVQGENSVVKVHPYSRAWAWLVSPELRAYSPEEAVGPRSP